MNRVAMFDGDTQPTATRPAANGAAGCFVVLTLWLPASIALWALALRLLIGGWR